MLEVDEPPDDEESPEAQDTVGPEEGELEDAGEAPGDCEEDDVSAAAVLPTAKSPGNRFRTKQKKRWWQAILTPLGFRWGLKSSASKRGKTRFLLVSMGLPPGIDEARRY